MRCLVMDWDYKSGDLLLARRSERRFAEQGKNSACTSEKEQVKLSGDLARPTSKSGGDPFEVFKDANFLSIYYLQDLSNISIEVLDEFGQGVYSNTVDPTSGGSLFIDISNWPARYYTLYFKDRSGNSIYGSFEIK